MSDKYCPVGKCECGHLKTSVTKMPDHSVTWCELLGFGLLVDDMDVCPWPSRQVRVEPQGDCDKCPKDDAYAAGRLAGLREAREAVANIRLRFDSDTPGNVDLTLPEFQWVRDKAIAAIDRLMGGK